MSYTAKDMVCARLDTWREFMVENDYQYSPEDTLTFIKECCELYDLDLKVVKEIFEEFEGGDATYDIDKDEIIETEEEETE